jgi:transposase
MKVFKSLGKCVILLIMKGFLNQAQRDALKAQHRQEKNRRVADRIKAVLLSDKGWTYRQIAEALLIDEQTISRHVDEYKEDQKLTLSSGGSMSKLSWVQSGELVGHLECRTYLKIADIIAYVSATYGISYTVQGMTSWMHTHGFSFKKPKGTPAKADPIKQEAFIQAYEKLLTETPEDEPILFGDGVHPTMATKVTYGWIRTGVNKPIATIASRTRMNLIGALNLESMQVTIGSYETINSETMMEYFDHLKAAYPEAPQIHLILDQGPYNISIVTREAAEKRGIHLHYLPPYSPNLNPIERLWKVMNEHVRNNRVFESAKEFRREITRFFEFTWPQIALSMTDRINDNFQRLNPTLST